MSILYLHLYLHLHLYLSIFYICLSTSRDCSGVVGSGDASYSNALTTKCQTSLLVSDSQYLSNSTKITTNTETAMLSSPLLIFTHIQCTGISFQLLQDSSKLARWSKVSQFCRKMSQSKIISQKVFPQCHKVAIDVSTMYGLQYTRM